MKHLNPISAFIMFMLMLIGTNVQATLLSATYGFDGVTSNIAGDVVIGETQLFVTVSGESDCVSGCQATFYFFNEGPAASSITDIYFDDGTLLGIASITSGSGTDFSQFASPPNLPGGELLDPDFETTAGFLADSNPPAQPNGVNPGEFMSITFNLINDQNIVDVFNALVLAGEPGGLRIGIHVQGFASEGSESFVNGPCLPNACPDFEPPPVPEPTTMWLLGLGLLGLARFYRNQEKSVLNA